MLDNIDKARQANAEMLADILSVLPKGENITNKDFRVDVAEEKIKILEIMMTATNTVLQDEECNYDVSEFRVLITDCGKLIKALDDNYNTTKLSKTVAQEYYAKQFSLNCSTVRCVYCRHLMFKEIPYCFNCFERN